MERLSSETPRDLIGQLRQRNEKEFACGLVMAVPTRSGDHMVVLLPIKRNTHSREYADDIHYYSAFGVHPERGLVLIRGEFAKTLLDYSERALKEISLIDPSEIVFPQDFDKLYEQTPGESWKPNVVNLVSIDDPVGWTYWERTDSFKEAYVWALKIAGYHVSNVAQRRLELTRATSFISS